MCITRVSREAYEISRTLSSKIYMDTKKKVTVKDINSFFITEGHKNVTLLKRLYNDPQKRNKDKKLAQ